MKTIIFSLMLLSLKAPSIFAHSGHLLNENTSGAWHFISGWDHLLVFLLAAVSLYKCRSSFNKKALSVACLMPIGLLAGNVMFNMEVSLIFSGVLSLILFGAALLFFRKGMSEILIYSSLLFYLIQHAHAARLETLLNTSNSVIFLTELGSVSYLYFLLCLGLCYVTSRIKNFSSKSPNASFGVK